MSKVETDQGLGPGSEDRRREVRQAQAELDSHAKLKAAGPVDERAEPQPGAGKVARKSDTVDDLLDGFGTNRPDLPRILPKEDTTPPPEPIKRELTPTEPGKRQKMRTRVLAGAAAFAVVALAGVAILKSKATPATSSPAPPPAVTATSAPTAKATAAATPTVTSTENIAATSTATAAATAPVEPPPEVARTTSTPPSRSARPVRTARSHAATEATARPPQATTAALAPHPPGSAPPGLNLLPDDPHR